MLNLAKNTEHIPSVADLRARFPDLDKVTIPMVRRSFDCRTHTATDLLNLARRTVKAERADNIGELMRRFRFSEEEARWALENVGMPE